MGTCSSILSAMEQPIVEFQNKTSEEKRIAILEKIRTEPKVVDLKLLFYMAACESITDDSTLIPSPKDYLGNKPYKEILQEINGCIPNVDLLRVYLEKPNLNKISDDTLSVLHWLLIALNEPRFVILDKEEEWPVLDVDEDLEQEGCWRKPDILVRLSYSTMSSRYMQWKAKSRGTKTSFGFIRVQMQDIHSAVHCGSRQLCNKAGLGHGLVLASNISTSIRKKKISWTWGKSNLGTQMSAAMMIEIADNLKTIVKRQNHRAIYYLISDPSYTRIRLSKIKKIKDEKLSTWTRLGTKWDF